MTIFIYLIIFGATIYCTFAELTFIDKYDYIHYDHTKLHAQHTRVARSLDTNIHLKFTCLNRTFSLHLQPTRNFLFDHDFIEINTNEREPMSKYENLFYDGYLIDEPQTSYASGSIIDGVFYGTISTSNGKYFIEPTRKYNQTHKTAHSIIYHENDVLHNYFKKNKTKRDTSYGGMGCASEQVHDWMKRTQQEIYEQNQNGDDFTYKIPNKYTKEANLAKERLKRNREPSRLHFPTNRTVCNMYLKVDHILYREVYMKEGGRNHETTVRFLMNYLQKHVETLNQIYSSLEFFNEDKSKYYVGLRFSIHRTKLITPDLCDNPEKRKSLPESEQRICEQYLDVQTFLNHVSLDDYSDFCVSYTFTARDFADGTLGLAWVAKPGSSGGVCERRQTVKSDGKSEMKSLNCGIVTVINYQARVAEAVSQITFAHEVGHNFGAEHDVDPCIPGEKNNGNFIMYSRATTGTQPNNRNFSECSREAMGKVMFHLISSSKFCLKEFNGSLCGNLYVEDGEECDCGYSSDCKETCCNDASKPNACKLVVGAECSPSQGPCCQQNCAFSPGNTQVCSPSTECLKDVYCNGQAAFCPKNDTSYFINFEKDGSLKDCNDGTQICHNGMCSGSICEKNGLRQCYLEGDLKDKKVNKEMLCHVACIGDATNNVCTDTFEIDSLINKKRNSTGFILKPGSACSGTQGYCDIFSKCRAVDAEGPLSRLKKLLLNPKTLTDIQTWIITYWWAVVLIAVGVITIMGIFIKVCSVHTPSSNPRKPPALKFTDTLRKPMKRMQHSFTHMHGHHQSRPHNQAPHRAKYSIGAPQQKKYTLELQAVGGQFNRQYPAIPL